MLSPSESSRILINKLLGFIAQHAQTKQSSALGEGPSFTVFMVKPSPALQEPSGATYMSTVDFDADASSDTFEHGPTDLPPRPYIGGPDATSPWKPRKNLGTIPGSAMDYVSSFVVFIL